MRKVIRPMTRMTATAMPTPRPARAPVVISRFVRGWACVEVASSRVLMRIGREDIVEFVRFWGSEGLERMARPAKRRRNVDATRAV